MQITIAYQKYFLDPDCECIGQPVVMYTTSQTVSAREDLVYSTSFKVLAVTSVDVNKYVSLKVTRQCLVIFV
jgi:hypothetical protein